VGQGADDAVVHGFEQPVAYPILDEVTESALALIIFLAGLPAAIRRVDELLHEKQSIGVFYVKQAVADEKVEEPFLVVHFFPVGLQQGTEHLVDHVLIKLEDQGVFGVEMVVNGTGSYAGLFGDQAHGRAVKAILPDQSQGTIEYC
jgi:hypothetical protein